MTEWKSIETAPQNQKKMFDVQALSLHHSDIEPLQDDYFIKVRV